MEASCEISRRLSGNKQSWTNNGSSGVTRCDGAENYTQPFVTHKMTRNNTLNKAAASVKVSVALTSAEVIDLAGSVD